MVKVIVKPKKAQNDSIPPASNDSVMPPKIIYPKKDSVKRPEVANPTVHKVSTVKDGKPLGGYFGVNVKLKKKKK